MRLLHVVPTYLPATRYGGPIHSVHGLCRALARRGHDVHVFTTNVDGPGVSGVPLGKPVVMDGVNITYFPTGFGRRLYHSTAMRKALARDLSWFDVAHLHSVFLWPTTAAARLARRRGVPYVISPRGMLVPELIARKSPLIKRAWIGIFEQRNLANAAAVHVTAEIEAEEMRRMGLSARRFDVIPNGVDIPPKGAVNIHSTDSGVATRKVLFLGRITWKKGLDRLISALAFVPDAELLIVGNDEEAYTPNLRALAEREGVSLRTHFLGPVYGAAKWQTFAAADLFVLPSLSENFGISVLEAMASGLPVIVTPEVGLAQAISDAGAGLVVEGTPEEIGAAITELIANQALRARMGTAGRQMAAQFSWDAISEQMEALYRGTISADDRVSTQGAAVLAK